MDLHSMFVVFVITILCPVNTCTARQSVQNDITRLTDKCLRFRYHDLSNVDTTTNNVIMFCASQAIKTIDKRTQKSNLSQETILYILELYRKMFQRKTGSKNLQHSQRQEVRTLSRSSWNSFVSRLNFLKTSMISGNLSRYDALSEMYTNLAINKPSFLIKHRVFLLLVEEALGTSVPYWDLRVDQNLTNPAKSIVWTPKYFGNGFGKVVTGPFADLISRDGKPLSRDIGHIGWLISQDNIDSIMSLGSHHDISEPNRFPGNSLEFLSTGPKLWVKGIPKPMSTDPLDPVFIMIDAFIDYIWDAFWKKLHSDGIEPRMDYQNLNDLNLDVFERRVLFNHQGSYGTDFTVKFHNHRVKRNTQNLLDWGAIYDFFTRIRRSRLDRRNRRTRLSGPQRARAAIAAIGPLPIGRRFTSPFTDPRTRGDPLPTAPLRRRLKRGFYPVINHRGIGSIGGEIKRFDPSFVGPKFKSILTDIRTLKDPEHILTKSLIAQKNENKNEGINKFQIKHRTPQK